MDSEYVRPICHHTIGHVDHTQSFEPITAIRLKKIYPVDKTLNIFTEIMFQKEQ